MPTVIKICEELYVLFCVHVLRLEGFKSSLSGTGQEGSRYTLRKSGYALSSLNRSGSKKGPDRSKEFKVYTGGGVEDYQPDIEGSSRNSRERIISGAITVRKEFHVSREDLNDSHSDSSTKTR